jgi:hypothetical protein
MRATVRGESAVLQCEFRNGYERLSVLFGWKMMHIVVCLVVLLCIEIRNIREQMT